MPWIDTSNNTRNFETSEEWLLIELGLWPYWILASSELIGWMTSAVVPICTCCLKFLYEAHVIFVNWFQWYVIHWNQELFSVLFVSAICILWPPANSCHTRLLHPLFLIKYMQVFLPTTDNEYALSQSTQTRLQFGCIVVDQDALSDCLISVCGQVPCV